MNHYRIFMWSVGLSLLSGTMVWVLVSLQPKEAKGQRTSPTCIPCEQNQLVPTPYGATPYASPFDPTPTLDPTQQAIEAISQPAPDARVRLGPITLTNDPIRPFPFSYTIEVSGNRETSLFIQLTATGERLHLGNDQGSSSLLDMNNRYIVWFFFCNGCKPTDPVPLHTGLYAYDLVTKQQLTLALYQPAIQFATIGRGNGDWVVYYLARPWKPETGHTGSLFAYHLPTGQTFLVDNNILEWSGGKAVPHYTYADNLYAVAGDTLVFQSLDKVRWCNLTTRFSHTLDLPRLVTPFATFPTGESPRYFSLSETAVVWWSEHTWWYYDLKYKELFAIPTIPPGWKYVSMSYPIMLYNRVDHAFWCSYVDINEKYSKTYCFKSAIIRDQ